MSDNQIPEEVINTLRDVTAVEAFALASAVVTVIAQGDAKIAEAITDLANTIFNEIMGITEGEPEVVAHAEG